MKNKIITFSISTIIILFLKEYIIINDDLLLSILFITLTLGLIHFLSFLDIQITKTQNIIKTSLELFVLKKIREKQSELHQILHYKNLKKYDNPFIQP